MAVEQQAARPGQKELAIRESGHYPRQRRIGAIETEYHSVVPVRSYIDQPVANRNRQGLIRRGCIRKGVRAEKRCFGYQGGVRGIAYIYNSKSIDASGKERLLPAYRKVFD